MVTNVVVKNLTTYIYIYIYKAISIYTIGYNLDVYIYNLSFRLVIPFNFRSGKYLYDYRTCIIRSTHAHNFAKESNGGSKEEEEEKKKELELCFILSFFFIN